MKRVLTAAGLVALAASTVITLSSSEAYACGGCFHQTASGEASVVTAHRMAVSIGTRETILWDQIEYAGSPGDFVWVLPVAGGDDVQVELADNAFFLALQEQTQVRLTGPTRSDFTGGGGGGGFGCAASGDALSAGEVAGPSTPPVQVFHEGTVGPYETATIASEDPRALYDWMNERGYMVPEEMIPTIEYYVAQGMSFVVLRLSPGEGVNRMQPVRVTTPGMNVSFPLRMVAAGVSDFVALELFVIAEGRYEAANFPNGTVNESDIIFDWAANEYNYDDLAAAVVETNAGRTWLTEFAAPVNGANVTAFQVTDDDGVRHSAAGDWRAATATVQNPTVTRMRANLPAQALSEDLILSASLEGEMAGQIFVTQDVNWTGSSVMGSLTERDAETRMAAAPLPLTLLGVLLAGFVGRRLRRRA